jgi:tartrate dehydrogenase/decarboxylase/D-malate dehydrogenase
VLRAGARQRARHLRQEDRQSDRADLVGRDDARAPRHKEAGDAIVRAIETVLKEGPRTRDMGGKANTMDVGKAIAEAL